MSGHCLLRVSKDRRVVLAEQETKLLKGIRRLEVHTTITLTNRGRAGQAQREIELTVAWSLILLLAPCHARERNSEAMEGSCIRVWETLPGKDPIEGLLFTPLALETPEQALEYVRCYSLRWLIEEDHKALKTGCAVEQSQLTSAPALKNLLAFLAIVSVRLLPLRCLARTQPDTRAPEQIDTTMLKLVAAPIKTSSATMTLQPFWHGLARLGGFLARKRDGEPGWQTLWKGWVRLQDLAWAMAIADST
jgi:hypothetical protein